MDQVMEVTEELKSLKLINVSIRNNVVIVNYNNPESKVNCYSSQCNQEVVKVFNYIEDNQKLVRGTVVTSSKVDNFFAGVDIKEINSWTPDYAYFISQKGQEVLRSFFHYSKPSVAVVMGSCLGAGFELANACKYKIAIDTPSTIFGLPEVQLGLIPGATGTVVTPRRQGFKMGIEMLLSGKTYTPRKAKELGLIDEVIPVQDSFASDSDTTGNGPNKHSPELSQEALTKTLSLLEDIGYKAIEGLESGLIHPRTTSWSEWAFLKGLEYSYFRDYIFSQLKREVIKKTCGLYPAPLEILSVLETSFRDGIDAGFQAESDAFKRVFQSKEHKCLLQVFNNQMHCKKNHYLIPKDGVTDNRKRSESNANSLVGIPSLLDGIKIELVSDDVSIDTNELKELMKSKGMNVVESSDGEIDTLKIFCSSYADLNEAKASVGMHFFSPLDRSLLVEVVSKSCQKSAEQRARMSQAVQVALNLNKIAITSTDGYFTTRLLLVLVIEAIDMLLCPSLSLDIGSMVRLFSQAGFPVDVFRQVDEIGIDVLIMMWNYFWFKHQNDGTKSQKFEKAGKSLRDRMITSKARRLLQQLSEEGLNGIKCSSGWYNYIEIRSSTGIRFKREKCINEHANKIVQHIKNEIRQSETSGISVDENVDIQLKERLVLSVINEALCCYNEGMISNPIEGDVGAVFGIAFPPLLVGPFHYCDKIDIKTLIQNVNDSTPYLPRIVCNGYDNSLTKFYS